MPGILKRHADWGSMTAAWHRPQSCVREPSSSCLAVPFQEVERGSVGCAVLWGNAARGLQAETLSRDEAGFLPLSSGRCMELCPESWLICLLEQQRSGPGGVRSGIRLQPEAPCCHICVCPWPGDPQAVLAPAQ